MSMRTDSEYDPLSSMIRFKTSSVLEMLLSLQTVYEPWRRPDLVEEVQSALGETFLDDLRDFYGNFHQGCDFTEIAVDTENHHDVSAFLSDIRKMDPRMLAFYILGRRYSPEDIPNPLTAAGVRQLIETQPGGEELLQYYTFLDWADDIEEVKKQLLDFWETYWNNYFHKKVESFKTLWDESFQEKREFLRKNGGTSLLTTVGGMETLPDPLPASMPYKRIEFFPLHTAPHRHICYYGYGVVSVLYDCTKTEEMEKEVKKGRDEAIAVCKALGDKNRLKILKLISLNEKSINGQKLAKRMDLSPSVVSRHLNMLKEAGLIQEFSPDNRNITYSVSFDAITSLPEKFQNYLAD